MSTKAAKRKKPTAHKATPRQSAKATKAPANAVKNAKPASTTSSPHASKASHLTRKPNKPADGVREGGKQAALIQLLKSEAGATLAQIMKLTGWQRHTVRGVISGVLKKKLKLEVASDMPADGERTYRITGPAAPAGTSDSGAGA